MIRNHASSAFAARDALPQARREIDRLRAQLAEAREALELYADSYPAGFGEVARRALAKLNKEVPR